LQDDNQATEQEKSSRLDELVAAARLDSITADFDDHGLSPNAWWSNLTFNFIEM
jgi:hypothetical protein